MQGIFVRNNELYVHGYDWMFVYGRNKHPDGFRERLQCDGTRVVICDHYQGVGGCYMNISTCSVVIDNDTYMYAGRDRSGVYLDVVTVKFTGDKWTHSTRQVRLDSRARIFLDGGELVGLYADNDNVIIEREHGFRTMFPKPPLHDFTLCDVRNGNILAFSVYDVHDVRVNYICILHEGHIICKYNLRGLLKRMVFVSDCVILVIAVHGWDDIANIKLINVADHTMYCVDGSDLRY